jgi:hypothetical protein
MRKLMMLATLGGMLAGCATTPDMTVHYFLPRADLQLTASKSVTCDSGDHIVSVVSVTGDPVYSADPVAKQEVRLKRLDGPFSDADLTFNFTEDGRLLGINADTTGEAGEIVKSGLALIAPVVAGGLVVPLTSPAANPAVDCANIASWGKDRTLTLTYTASVPFSSGGGPFNFKPDLSSETYDRLLAGSIGSVCGVVGPAQRRDPIGIPHVDDPRGDVRLTLLQPSLSPVDVFDLSEAGCKGAATPVRHMLVSVPQLGEPYDLLIPRAAAFGKQTFSIKVSEAGNLTEVKYGKTNGTASALDAATAALNAATLTPAEQTQQANDRMAAIAAQEKLARCLADHTKCGS